MTHIPAHLVPFEFPNTLEGLQQYDAVIISDVGANTFYLHHDTFYAGKATPNLPELIRQCVAEGGALGMMGGYLTFMGIEAKGQWRNTPVEQALPVTMLPCDDRREHPEDPCRALARGTTRSPTGLPQELPALFGYNALTAKAQAKVLIHYESDPILTVWEYNEGRELRLGKRLRADWMPEEFCQSDCNPHALEQCPSLGSEADLRRIQGGYQL
ncbi:MAG: glutamine amidotransferase [Acutalibacteraceae bacterium]